MGAQEDPRLVNFQARLHSHKHASDQAKRRLEELVEDGVAAMIELVQDEETQQMLWRNSVMRESITVLMRNGTVTFEISYNRDREDGKDLAVARVNHMKQAWKGRVTFTDERTVPSGSGGYIHYLKFRATLISH